MIPVGPLMIEHRLIERMIKLMKIELARMRQQNKAEVAFIDTAVDFIRMYADRCHHGKEEDILFRALSKKQLSGDHKMILDELAEEHRYARATTGNLVAGNKAYAQGKKGSFFDIMRLIEELVLFYPKHIEKEDKHFFLACMGYFSKQEQNDMLEEFWEFDRKLIHEKYKNTLEQAEKQRS